jgi:hypothetical protein
MTQSTDTSAAFQRRVLIARACAMHWPGSVVVSGMPISANPRSWQSRLGRATPTELAAIGQQLSMIEQRDAHTRAVIEELNRRRAVEVQAAADAEETCVEQALQRRSLRRTIERALSKASVRSSARRSGEA